MAAAGVVSGRERAVPVPSGGLCARPAGLGSGAGVSREGVSGFTCEGPVDPEAVVSFDYGQAAVLLDLLQRGMMATDRSAYGAALRRRGTELQGRLVQFLWEQGMWSERPDDDGGRPVAVPGPS